MKRNIQLSVSLAGDDDLLVKRGDVFFADLSPVIGSEQGGTRPVLIIQNDIGNRFSPTVIVAAITAQIQKAKLPTHVEIKANKYGFKERPNENFGCGMHQWLEG